MQQQAAIKQQNTSHQNTLAREPPRLPNTAAANQEHSTPDMKCDTSCASPAQQRACEILEGAVRGRLQIGG